MKHKVSKLSGAMLDQAVALAEGWTRTGKNVFAMPDGKLVVIGTIGFMPSRKWEIGGPIIERERIEIGVAYEDHTAWNAFVHGTDASRHQLGPTPLIAAMRAYVASKFGGEIAL